MTRFPLFVAVSLAGCDGPRPERYMENCDSERCENPELVCSDPVAFYYYPNVGDAEEEAMRCQLPCEEDWDCPELLCVTNRVTSDGSAPQSFSEPTGSAPSTARRRAPAEVSGVSSPVTASDRDSGDYDPWPNTPGGSGRR